jgi:CMP-2-keto-3-deoxyoctulosonic acid synthetase
MQTVEGVPMLMRVWRSANCSWADKVVVAWPERYPDVDENDVLERFKRIVEEFKPTNVIRLTADCPLITPVDINQAIKEYKRLRYPYYNNRRDGHDVQIFTPDQLYVRGHREHVINDAPNLGGTSVNTKEDLNRVRKLAR